MFIVRYSEIGLKGSKARDRMEQVLVRNIKKGLAIAGIEPTVRRAFGRIYVECDPDVTDVGEVLSRTMGIKNYSPAVEMEFSRLDDIVSRAVSLWSDSVRGKSFAVRARRNGQHEFGSPDVMNAVADAIYEFSGKVDLTNPEIELHVEVRDSRAYFFTEQLPGPGGLPLGSEGRLVALVSGGIDSPVAAWSVMKRGCPTDIIFFSLAPPVDTRDFLRAVSALVGKWGHGYDPRIHIIDGRDLVIALADRTKFRMTNVTYKRILYLVAQRIAMKAGAHGIVTGESLGQVSSQTPESLHATSHGLEIPVMRPLLGMDKDEIVALARRIGTFPETSSGEFCSLFSAHPITSPKVEELEDDMRNFTQLEDLISRDTVIRGSQIDSMLREVSGDDIMAEDLPEDAVVVDLRSGEKFQKWHYPGALNTTLPSLDTMLEKEGRRRTYVFYCMKGLQSAFAASKARENGVDAYYITEERIRKLQQRKEQSSSTSP